MNQALSGHRKRDEKKHSNSPRRRVPPIMIKTFVNIWMFTNVLHILYAAFALWEDYSKRRNKTSCSGRFGT